MIPIFVQKRLEAWSPGFSPLLFKALLVSIAASAIAIPLIIVALPFLELLNDMAVQHKGKAQSLHGTLHDQPMVVERRPVEGTMPMSFHPYEIEGVDEEAAVLAGQTLVNPLPVSMEVLEQGRGHYEALCITCHGENGDGDGGIVGPDLFPAPPSLHTDTARAFADGRIFHVITRGQNSMPGQADKLSPEERWATIHFLRALQRARNPQPEDLDR